jgi:hypothetical protein
MKHRRQGSGITALLDGGEWSASSSGRFTPSKGPPHVFTMGLDGPQKRSGRFGGEGNLLPLKEFEQPIIQPVA